MTNTLRGRKALTKSRKNNFSKGENVNFRKGGEIQMNFTLGKTAVKNEPHKRQKIDFTKAERK